MLFDATKMQGTTIAVSVIENEGILIQLQVVKRVFDKNGKTIV